MTSESDTPAEKIVKKPRYKRVVLKLSGEAFAGSLGFGIDLNVVNSIAQQIKEVFEKQVGI